MNTNQESRLTCDIYGYQYIFSKSYRCYLSSQFKHFVPFCRYYVSSGNRAFPFNFRRLSFSFLQDQISSVCQKSFSSFHIVLCEQSFYTCNPSIKIYLVFWITIFLSFFLIQELITIVSVNNIRRMNGKTNTSLEKDWKNYLTSSYSIYTFCKKKVFLIVIIQIHICVPKEAR